MGNLKTHIINLSLAKTKITLYSLKQINPTLIDPNHTHCTCGMSMINYYKCSQNSALIPSFHLKSILLWQTMGNDFQQTGYQSRDGIPCRSPYLPNNISSIESIKNRTSFILFTICQKKCSNDAIGLNTTEKIMRFWSQKSQLVKSFRFKMVYIGDRVVITCNRYSIWRSCERYLIWCPIPWFRAHNGSEMYNWHNVSLKFVKHLNQSKYFKSLISPLRAHLRSKGRVKIDFMNNLVINYVLKSDQRLYMSVFAILGSHVLIADFDRCRDAIGSEVGVTKLIVRSRVKQLTIWSGGKIYFSAFLIIFTICSFGYSVWKNRDLKTKI